MLLSIIIVSYNTKNLLRKCLLSVTADLAESNLSNESELIVVDNASEDRSVEMMEKGNFNIKIIKKHKNTGFAKANNIGIKKAQGEYILLLNSDTEIKNGAILKLINAIRSNKMIGVVGGKLLNYDNSTQPSLGFFPHIFKVFLWMFFLDDLPLIAKFLKPYHVNDPSFYENRHEVDWVSGACFMFRKKMNKKAGTMDENIFMYGEELEWCYRIKKSGYKVYYIPDARIVHSKGASAEIDSKNAGIIEEFFSLIYFYKKHKSRWQNNTIKIIIKFGALLRIVLFAIIRKYSFRIPIYVKTIQMVR